MHLELSILDDNEDEKIETIQRGSRRKQMKNRYQEDTIKKSQETRAKKPQNTNVKKTQETAPTLKVSEDVFQTLHTMSQFLTQPDAILDDQPTLKNEVDTLLNASAPTKTRESDILLEVNNKKIEPEKINIEPLEKVIESEKKNVEILEDVIETEKKSSEPLKNAVELKLEDNIKARELEDLEKIIREKEKLLAEMQNLDRLIKEKEEILVANTEKEKAVISSNTDIKTIETTMPQIPIETSQNIEISEALQTSVEKPSQNESQEENLAGKIRVKIKTEERVIKEFQVPKDNLEDIIKQDLANGAQVLIEHPEKSNTVEVQPKNKITEVKNQNKEKTITSKEKDASNVKGQNTTKKTVNPKGQTTEKKLETPSNQGEDKEDSLSTVITQTIEAQSQPLKKSLEKPTESLTKQSKDLQTSLKQPLDDKRTDLDKQDINEKVAQTLDETQKVQEKEEVLNQVTELQEDLNEVKKIKEGFQNLNEIQKETLEEIKETQTEAQNLKNEVETQKEVQKLENEEETQKEVENLDKPTEAPQSINVIYQNPIIPHRNKAQIEAIVNDALAASHLDDSLENAYMEAAKLEYYLDTDSDEELEQEAIDQIFNSYFKDKEPIFLYSDVNLEELKEHIDKQILQIKEY